MAKNISVSKLPKKKNRKKYGKKSIYCQKCSKETDEFTEVPFMKKVRIVKGERIIDPEKIKVCSECVKEDDKFGLL